MSIAHDGSVPIESLAYGRLPIGSLGGTARKAIEERRCLKVQAVGSNEIDVCRRGEHWIPGSEEADHCELGDVQDVRRYACNGGDDDRNHCALLSLSGNDVVTRPPVSFLCGALVHLISILHI